MTYNRRVENTAEHQEVSALLPWYVNDTLGERERVRVNAHIGECVACRDDLAVNQRIFDEITARSSRFVQSFSADGGKTWEANAIARFTRAG